MDKRLYGVLLGLLALIVCGAVIVLLADGDPPVDPINDPLPSGGETAAPAYIVREYNGGIAVFFGESSTPAMRYDIPVYTLPESDRRLLSQGIPAYTEAELQSIIEDYTS